MPTLLDAQKVFADAKQVQAAYLGTTQLARLRTNLLTNPTFETAGATPVEVRRNLLTNPTFETDLTGWVGASATVVQSPDWAHVGTRSVRCTLTGSASSGDLRLVGGSATTFSPPLQPGHTYTASAYIYLPGPLATYATTPTARQLRILFFYHTGGEGSAAIAAFGPQAPNVAGVHRVTHTFTVPANATGAYLGVGCAGSSADIGKYQYVDAVLVEETGTVGPYFDGATPAVGDFTYRWAGAPYASPSIESGASVEGVTGAAGRAAIQSTAWSASGARSMRIIPQSPAASANGALVIPGTTLTAGRTYTAQATIRLAAAQTGTLDPLARRILIGAPGAVVATSPQAPNTAGVTRLAVTFAADGTSATDVRLTNGAAGGGGDVWWDDMLLVEGPYAGPYFDGNTPRGYWSGTPHASTSQLWSAV